MQFKLSASYYTFSIIGSLNKEIHFRFRKSGWKKFHWIWGALPPLQNYQVINPSTASNSYKSCWWKKSVAGSTLKALRLQSFNDWKDSIPLAIVICNKHLSWNCFTGMGYAIGQVWIIIPVYWAVQMSFYCIPCFLQIDDFKAVDPISSRFINGRRVQSSTKSINQGRRNTSLLVIVILAREKALNNIRNTFGLFWHLNWNDD